MASEPRESSPAVRTMSRSLTNSPSPVRTRSVASSSRSRSPFSRSPRSPRNKSPRFRSPRSPRSPAMKVIDGDREKPEPSNCLGVFGLNYSTTEDDLDRKFSEYGKLEKINLVLDGPSRKSRGFGFIYFEKVEDAGRAREAMNGEELQGFKLRVDFSLTRSGHKPTPGVYYHRGKALKPGERQDAKYKNASSRSRRYRDPENRDQDFRRRDSFSTRDHHRRSYRDSHRDIDRYTDDRYREERYRDDWYRDERYISDRYRGDRYRDERYPEDRYRDDRYRDYRYQDERLVDDRRDKLYHERSYRDREYESRYSERGFYSRDIYPPPPPHHRLTSRRSPSPGPSRRSRY